ncbi:UNVERIFIED_ORG: hypothetical protein M2348_001649 [Sphingomonas sp. R1F5B]
MSTDTRAIKILMNTYWSAGGWRREPQVSPEDFAYAKLHRLMFDPTTISHSEAIDAAIKAIASTDQKDVVSAFVSSLGSRRLDLRSGLGSYAIGRHFQRHEASTTTARSPCGYCGFYNVEDAELSVLNFERLKWGGVRHDHPVYISLDLELLRDAEFPEPTPADFAILNAILDTARSMPPNSKLADLDKSLAKVLRSNSAERRCLIGILGYAGILIDPTRPSFRTEYVPAISREQTPWYKDDWPYPVQWWNGSFGVQQSAVNDWFPDLGN